jgi:hypothetical protein
LVAVVGTVLGTAPGPVFAQTTAFSYQGILNSQGNPVTGSYDFLFDLYSAETGGSSSGAILSLTTVPVANGRFHVMLDFGMDAFDGSPRWLSIAVRPSGPGNYSYLSPRQPVLAVPYAVSAQTAQTAQTAVTAQTAQTAVAAQTAQVATTTAPASVNSASIQDGAVTAAKIATGQVVKSVNGLSDGITIAAGQNVTVTPSGNQLTISATDAGGSAELPTPFRLDELAYAATEAYAQDVGLVGDFAIVADGYKGLSIYDVSNPFRPTLVANRDVLGDAQAVSVAGKYAYLGVVGGLRIVYITAAGQPLLVGRHDVEGVDFNDIAVDGSFAYVAAEDGLRIYNVANQDTPTLLGSRFDGGSPTDVAVSGGYVYLANGADGLRVYNVANPTVPVPVAHFPPVGFLGQALAVAAAGQHLFVGSSADGADRGFQVYNISNPNNIQLVTRVTLPVEVRAVAVQGNLLYAATYGDGLRVFDVADISAPKEVGHVGCEVDLCFAQGVAAQGLFAYAARHGGGLAVYFAAPLATVAGAVNATAFVGDGTTLTNLNASQLAKGDVPLDALDNAWKVGGNTSLNGPGFLGTANGQVLKIGVSGYEAITLDPGGIPSGPEEKPLVTLNGNTTLNHGILFFNWGYTNHGIGFFPDQLIIPFGGKDMDGPVLFGRQGGILGTANNGAGVSLSWDKNGVDIPGTLGARAIRAQGDFELLVEDSWFLSGIRLHKEGIPGYPSDGRTPLLEIQGDASIGDHDLWFRWMGNTNHGVGYYGVGKAFGAAQPDGPVLYGNGGGALGTTGGGPKTALTWHADGNVVVPGNLRVEGIFSSQNSPRVAASHAAGSVYADSDTEILVLEKTISCPGPGSIVVLGSAVISSDPNNLVNPGKVGLILKKFGTVVTSRYVHTHTFNGSYVKDYQVHVFAVTDVSAKGNVDLSLTAKGNDSNITAGPGDLIAMFFPAAN